MAARPSWSNFDVQDRARWCCRIGISCCWVVAVSASKFDEVASGSTFCSLNNEHSVVNLDKNGNVQVDRNKNVCITLTKVEDVWKMRTQWWSEDDKFGSVEYSLAGWINPRTLAYLEVPSAPNKLKVIGEGHIRFIDKDTVNYFQYGLGENGSVGMLSENLVRVESLPVISVPMR